MAKPISYSITFFTLFPILLYSSDQSFAADVIEEDSLLMNNEELLFTNIPSVFSASKYEQKITEAPARISVVTANEIQRYGHRTLVDVLNSLPGLQSSYDRNYSFVGSRGIGVLGDYNTRILLLLDGHRLNENVYDGTVLDHGFSVDIDLIERVELVRSGLIALWQQCIFRYDQCDHKTGRDIQGTEVSAAAGSQESYQGRFTYGKRLDNGFEILLSASGYDSAGDDRLYYAEVDE